jgi:hypothetical protein
MINNNLLNGIASLLTGGTFNIPSHLAFGSTTGTLTATDVVTSGEFDRNALSSDSSSTNTATFIGSRTSVEANNEAINLISLVNSATVSGSNDIMSNFLMPSIIHSTSFDISIELTYTITRG